MRSCTKCGETKPDDEFCKGVKRRCLACHREMTTAWRGKNRDYHRVYYLKNRPPLTRVIPEVVNGKKPCNSCGIVKPLEEFHRQGGGVGERRAKCKICLREANIASGDGARRAAEFRKQNPNYQRDWAAKNRDKVAANHFVRQRRTTITLGVSDEYFKYVVIKLRERPCDYCGGPGGEVDHIVPLARGGLHHPHNMVACCRRCNASKHSKLVSEWKPPAHQQAA